jgi:hypothetical protein
MAVLVVCSVFCVTSLNAAENTVVLNCNLTGKKVLKSGSGASASLLDEETRTFAEDDEIDLSAKTWRIVGSSDAPAKMASLTPHEFVLSDSSLGSSTTHWSIDRRTGVYNLRQTHFDSLRNETVEVTMIGACKNGASAGSNSF